VPTRGAGRRVTISARTRAATADVTARGRGIAMRDETRKGPQYGTSGGYAINDQVEFLRTRSRVGDRRGGRLASMIAVFVRFAAGGGGSQLGAFRKSADTATAVALPGAIYKSSQATPGGLALVEINLP
jgi:hypothetical protein